MSIKDQLDEMEHLGYVDIAPQWEWDALDMYYDPAGRIFRWYSSGGCSCNSIDEDYESMESLGEMEFGRQDEAIRAVRRFIEDADATDKAAGQELIAAIKSCRGDLVEKFIDEGHRPVMSDGVL